MQKLASLSPDGYTVVALGNKQTAKLSLSRERIRHFSKYGGLTFNIQIYR